MKIGHQGGKRGASILLLSFVFMVVLFLLASSLYSIVPAEFHMASRSQQDLQGHYVARAGLEETMTWFSSQMDKFTQTQLETDLPDYNTGDDSSPVLPLIDAAVAAIEGRSPVDDPDWRVNIDVVPLQTSVGVKHALQPRFYSISSTSIFRGKPIKRIDILVRQQTFASFAYMTNHMVEGTEFEVTDKPTFNGPVHTNEYLRFKVEPGLWSKAITPEKAFFQDIVSHAEVLSGSPDGNYWFGGASNSPETNSENAGYELVFSTGRSGLRKKNAIPLPETSDDVRAEAWKSIDPEPTTNGLHLSKNTDGKVDGGIYFEGNVDEMILTLDKEGNQRIVFERSDRVSTTTQVWDPNRTVQGPEISRTWNPNKGACVESYIPQGSSGGGLNGGTLDPICTKWAGGWDIQYGPRVPAPGYVNQTVNVDTETRWEVIEVTEGNYPYTDQNGQPQVATLGDTLNLKIQRTKASGSNWTSWSTTSSERVRGQINGTVFVNGSIGRQEDGVDTGKRGLWGITKGSAKVDASGNFILDSDGKKTYQNKTIATPLDKTMNLGGDLLQFNQAKFEGAKASGVNFANTTGNKRNWAEAALNPDVLDGDGNPAPELSPNNDHVLGLFSRDIWMKGKKGVVDRSGPNGINDIYAVMLAGKKVNDTKAIGGFGTWHDDRDNLNDGLGYFRILGGVIQGTTGANSGNPNDSKTHVFKTSGIGYEVQMFYDIEATRQRLFPTVPEFRVVRYLERSARERT